MKVELRGNFLVATPMCDHVDMPLTEETVIRLRQAVRAKNRAEAAAEKAREALAEAIAAAMREGMKPTDVVKETDYSREHVRRIARDHHVPPLREATVVSKRAEEARQAAISQRIAKAAAEDNAGA